MIYLYLAFLIDLIIGDPYFLPHPIRFIGFLISQTEKTVRSIAKTPLQQKIGGFFVATVPVIITVFIVVLILEICKINNILYAIINTYLIFSCIATKCLKDEAKKVYNALQNNDIQLARKRISYLVGRNTENLSEEEIIRATVETVAENTSDGVVAPIFYASIGGAPLAFFYKTVNTLDSMVGYINEKYKDIGFFSAKIDDALNFIPARITGFLFVLASFICGLSYKNSFKVLKRDRLNHKSPNAGYPEAAVAGALGIRLGGASYYFGEKIEKPTIGDNLKKPEKEDILKAIKLMYVSAFLSIIIFSAIYYVGRIFFRWKL